MSVKLVDIVFDGPPSHKSVPATSLVALSRLRIKTGKAFVPANGSIDLMAIGLFSLK